MTTVSRATTALPSDRHATRIAYLLARAERGIRAELDAVTPGHRLSTPKYTALSVLRRHPGLSSAELARAAFVTPQAMHPFVTSLEDDRLVERRPDPANRRILRITLTPRGAKVLAACDRDVDEMEARALHGLSAKDQETLRQLLRAIDKNLARPDSAAADA